MDWSTTQPPATGPRLSSRRVARAFAPWFASLVWAYGPSLLVLLAMGMSSCERSAGLRGTSDSERLPTLGAPTATVETPLGSFRLTYYYIAHEAHHHPAVEDELGASVDDIEATAVPLEAVIEEPAEVPSGPSASESEALPPGPAPEVETQGGVESETPAVAPPAPAVADHAAPLNAFARPAPDAAPVNPFEHAELAVAASQSDHPSPAAAAAIEPAAEAHPVEPPTVAPATPTAPRAAPSPRPSTVTLYEPKTCRPLTRVNERFAADMAMEGSGRLRDGRLLNYAGPCSCDRSPCFREIKRRVTWGIGAHLKALTPFRSIAVDRRLIPLGTVLYIPELDGRTMPGPAPWGGFVHDGCVVAEDTGGGISGHHIDFFVANRATYRGVSKTLRLSRVTLYDGRERCAGSVAQR